MKKGFTLIEILVVVAILAVLSGVVLAFLSSARNGGNDVAVRSNLREVKNLVEIYANDVGQYATNSCGLNSVPPAGTTGCLGSSVSTNCQSASASANFISVNADVRQRLRDADLASGGVGTATTLTNIRCGLRSGEYAIAGVLRATNKWYCIDSSGSAVETRAGGLTPFPAPASASPLICTP